MMQQHEKNTMHEYLSHIGIHESVCQKLQKKLCENLELKPWKERYENGDARSKLLFAPNFSGKKMLEIIKNHGYEKKIFTDTYVTDIGAGVGGLCFELEDIVKEIYAVDPLYGDEERYKKVHESLGALEFINAVNGEFHSRYKEVKELKEKEFKLWEEYNKYHELKIRRDIISIQESIDRIKKEVSNEDPAPIVKIRNQIREDIHRRQKNKFESTEKIKIRADDGQNILSIQENTQDYVFINFLLDKSTVHPCKVLSEASRILKPGGKIFSINNKLGEKLYFFADHNISEGYDKGPQHDVLIFTKKQ